MRTVARPAAVRPQHERALSRLWETEGPQIFGPRRSRIQPGVALFFLRLGISAPEREGGGMNRHPNALRGERNRHQIAEWIAMGRPEIGSALPRNAWFAQRLGIHPDQASRHVGRVVRALGIEVRIPGNRRVVAAIHSDPQVKACAKRAALVYLVCPTNENEVRT